MRVTNKSVKAQTMYYKEMDQNNQINIDDRPIPTLKNKDRVKDEIPEEEKLERGELEELESNIRNSYEPLLKYFSEETLRQLFSKQVLYREEGLETLLSKLDSILSDRSSLTTNINNTMKLLFYQLCEKHPQTAFRSIEIFEKLLNLINKLPVKELNYDFGVTDSILVKIKEKVGDINTRVRKRAVELYAFMMKKNFCDYNNLINELIDDEVGGDNKDLYYGKSSVLSLIGKPMKSSKVVLGKLDIFENVLKDFDQAIKEKRTEIHSFPFNNVFNYICLNLTHPKTEVRKNARKVVIQAKEKFGYKKLEPYLRRVDLKELEKIQDSLPELKEFIKEENEKIKLSKNPDLVGKGQIAKEELAQPPLL
eukprot:CAMPEP_0170524270 /NCGR_PEP_ID=MMETSP0209-20121228/9701_1 /TAXON_ID=665100 ORGANISM="Litonotus pictus, Strain P1" /NCGR_SAMPLE_ID=MMETSP0209 /ASSEMBLY_ACC=CAM_ASM_000301 /LENGTH=365 /DNA_ID=CAMNT_0010812845 /DNA_START=116 /DNA_END=1214 /DNA_ORIENTATION=-